MPAAHTPTMAGAEELCQQEAASAAIEQPLFCSEESRKNRSQATANTVYGRCAYGVVNFQHMVDKVDCKYHYHAANGTDKYRPERRYQVTSRRDAHQSCQHTVQCEGQGRFAILHPTRHQCEETSCTSCQVGGEEHMRNGRRSPLVAAANCEPGLNPNQPNQRINTPRQASVKL